MRENTDELRAWASRPPEAGGKGVWLSEVWLREVYLHKVPKRGQGRAYAFSQVLLSIPVLSAPAQRRRREGERQFSMSPLPKLHIGIWGGGGNKGELSLLVSDIEAET